MNDEDSFCEKVRELAPNCSGEFIEEIKAIRASVKPHVAHEKKGQSTGKADTLAALSELHQSLVKCIQIIDGKDDRLNLGIVDLNAELCAAYDEPDDVYIPTGCNAALEHLRRMQDAVCRAQALAKKGIPDKRPKFALRTAAVGVCALLERHNYSVSAYNDSQACQLINALMESLNAALSADSYRKAIQSYLDYSDEDRRSAKAYEKVLDAVAAAWQGKSLSKKG